MYSLPLGASMLDGTEAWGEGVHTMTADFRWTPRVEQVLPIIDELVPLNNIVNLRIVSQPLSASMLEGTESRGGVRR